MSKKPYLVLTILTLLNLINYIDRYVVPSVQDQIRSDFLLSHTQIGFLASAFTIIYLAASPVMGWLGDKFSRKRLILGAALIWSIATFFSGLAANYTELLICRLLVGVGEAAYVSITPAIIGAYFSKEKRGS